jgi:hypothetical protein
VVAGGGGGGTTTLASINRAGGAGGIVGVDGSSGITTFSGKGGTASAGGAGGIGGNPGGAGFLGIGGAGGTSGSRSGGGGGAGYYGGGGGSTGDVNVGSGGGGSSAGPTGTSVDGPNSGDGSITITAVPVAPPTVTGIAPTTGPAAGGNSITITGTGFAAGATATIGGTVCANPIVTGTTSITCISPAGNPGAANVTVTNPDAQSSVLANAYTYVPNTQLPLLNCVTAPRVIPRRGVRQLLANRCVTNAGQPVRVWVTGFLRGDVSYWTEIRKRNGAVWIKTHGYRLKLRITWKAPATSTYSAYTLTRSYRT